MRLTIQTTERRRQGEEEEAEVRKREDLLLDRNQEVDLGVGVAGRGRRKS